MVNTGKNYIISCGTMCSLVTYTLQLNPSLHMYFIQGMFQKSRSLPCIALSKDIFERHTVHHTKELVFTFIMMLIFSRCIVSFNNYSTFFMANSIPLACFHVIEL